MPESTPSFYIIMYIFCFLDHLIHYYPDIILFGTRQDTNKNIIK